MTEFFALLKKNGFVFHWNDFDKHWWLTKTGWNGKILRTDPIKAEDERSAAEAAVTRYVKGPDRLKD